MANPFTFGAKSLENGQATVYLEFTAGTSGAVPTSLTRSIGIGAVAKVGGAAGTYTITMSEPWAALLALSGQIVQATFDKTHACAVNLKTDAVATTGIITIECRTLDGNAALADITSGDVIKVTLHLQYIAP